VHCRLINRLVCPVSVVSLSPCSDCLWIGRADDRRQVDCTSGCQEYSSHTLKLSHDGREQVHELLYQYPQSWPVLKSIKAHCHHYAFPRVLHGFCRASIKDPNPARPTISPLHPYHHSLIGYNPRPFTKPRPPNDRPFVASTIDRLHKTAHIKRGTTPQGA
jgi:hypothetical protein